MTKTEKLKETDLYIPVRNYLESLGFTVNSEVMHCDVTALRDGILAIVEMKTSLNLDVILQAVQRQKIADLVYIAVPKKGRLLFTKRWKNICHLLRRLELGLLLVVPSKSNFLVEEAILPVPFDRSRSISYAKRRRKAVVYEIHERHGDYNTGGSSGKKLVTAYRELAIRIGVVLKENGPCSVKKIKEVGSLPAKISRILNNNHYGWFERTKRGVYTLSEKALKELDDYSEFINRYIKNGTAEDAEAQSVD